MTDTTAAEQLERELQHLSAPDDARPVLWAQALHSVLPNAAPDHADEKQTRFSRPLSARALMIAAAVAMVTFAALAVLVPSLGGPRLSTVAGRHDSRLSDRIEQLQPTPASQALRRDLDPDSPARSRTPSLSSVGPSTPRSVQPFADAAEPARHVVRKATVDLRTADVPTAMSKVMFLVSEASGEYVEASSLHGSGDRAGAVITIRVRSERLGAVLVELRKLGEVTAESAGGEDVSTQVVDLDARLRNERRVEQELLELLTNRHDAPLKEVLDLRNELNRVRETIEQLQAQRDRFARLVSLATVLVNLRAADEPIPAEPGVWSYLSERVSFAFSQAVRFLIDTLATLTAVVIGGAPFWFLLIGVVLAFRAHWKHRRMTLASEPAPSIDCQDREAAGV